MALTALAFILMMAFSVVNYFLPRLYFAKVTIEPRPDYSGPTNNIFAAREDFAVEPQFISTPFTVMQSRGRGIPGSARVSRAGLRVPRRRTSQECRPGVRSRDWDCRVKKVRFRGTRKPALGTSALPEAPRPGAHREGRGESRDPSPASPLPRNRLRRDRADTPRSGGPRR